MTNVIAFLEAMGACPAPDAAGYRQAVEAMDVPPDMRRALLRRDATAVNGLLGGRAAMWCAIMSPEEAPVRESPDTGTPDEGTPDGDAPDGDAPTRVDPSPDANEA